MVCPRRTSRQQGQLTFLARTTLRRRMKKTNCRNGKATLATCGRKKRAVYMTTAITRALETKLTGQPSAIRQIVLSPKVPDCPHRFPRRTDSKSDLVEICRLVHFRLPTDRSLWEHMGTA